MPLQIIRNDITRVKADAIVNTANPKPLIGGGTDTAVYKAAGEKRLLAARKLIGDIAPGHAVETAAYNLNARFIIHTVCVPWSAGAVESLDVLSDCYHNSLALAEELNCRSVAFPLIGTGAYGIPHDDALGVARDVIKGFLTDHKSSMKVLLVLFDKESVESASSLSHKIRTYIDETYVANAVADEYGFDRDREIRSDRLFTRANKPCAEDDDDTASFAQKMFEYVAARGIKDSALYGGKYELYFKKQILSNLRSDYDYHPSKYVCIVICLVLKLDLDLTLDLLARAGYTLSRSRKADVVVRACIANGIHDVYSVDSALHDNGCEELRKIK